MLKELFNRIRNSFGRINEDSFDENTVLDDSPLVSDDGDKKVCVLEFYQCMRELYAKYLGRAGFSYFITGKEEDFLSESAGCSAVVLDDCQPDIRGFLLASKLKAERPELPVIVCTANACLEAYEEFKVSKADALLFKPVSGSELADCINRVLVKGSAKPVVEKKVVPRKRGRKPFTFLDIAEKHVREFSDSGLSKAEFARKNKLSLSTLKNEFRIVAMPETAKKIVQENIDCFKKSFFEHITKLKDEQSIFDLCGEIIERGSKGSYYDLSALKERVTEYLSLEKKDEV
ncbi:MAG: hypothetical protein DRN14_02765 [Thermoplasmata archaeon]|nr:MAG: hypothetical protein DRN14_02765 [Thermoplasmata archaeon]